MLGLLTSSLGLFQRQLLEESSCGRTMREVIGWRGEQSPECLLSSGTGARRQGGGFTLFCLSSFLGCHGADRDHPRAPPRSR